MAREKLSDYIIPIGVLILGYSVMSNLGLVGPTTPKAVSTNISPECPRGQKYNTEIWRDCDPGYLGERTSWLPFSPQSCVCQGKIPAPTVKQETPSTPAPAPTSPDLLGQIIDYFSGGGGGQDFQRSAIPPTLAPPQPIVPEVSPISSGSLLDTLRVGTGSIQYVPSAGFITPFAPLTPYQQLLNVATPGSSTTDVQRPLSSSSGGGTYPAGSYAGKGGIID